VTIPASVSVPVLCLNTKFDEESAVRQQVVHLLFLYLQCRPGPLGADTGDHRVQNEPAQALETGESQKAMMFMILEPTEYLLIFFVDLF
jgi:hypothetical protein